MPQQIQNSRTATQIFIGVSMGLAAILSLISMSSLVGVWSMINHFQMLLLLLITGAFIPRIVRQYLIGMNFVLNICGFVPSHKVPLIANLFSWMKFEQYNEDLHDIGVEDGSTVVNNLSSLIILLFLIILQLFFAIIYT